MSLSPVLDDPTFSTIRRATIGIPILVRSPEGKEAYWFVPLITGTKASGFARVDKNLRVSQVGLFGANPDDQGSWIDVSFFERPPPEAINSIKARYPEMEMSVPFFSYDQSPAKWGWIVKLKDKRMITIFITPGGWYEQIERNANIEG
jgi:hypothetical protein